MPKPLPIIMSSEALRRRRARNRAIFGVLLAFVVLIYVISILKMKGIGN